ncbi:MAG: iron ABC transporter permease [Clostridia bacterium]|nr:iron ABC transporter permease [Clostridia bacterium]
MIKSTSYEQKNKIRVLIIIGTLVLLVAVFLLGCSMGPYAIPFADVIDTLFGGGTERMKLVVFEFRLPRLCLALLVGFGMGAAGVIMQNLLHNDLASPGTLGVADGSSLFVTLYVALIAKDVDKPILLPVLALIGGLISAGIIYLLGTKRKKPLSSTKLIMTGVAMGACYSAIATFVMYMLDENQLEFIQRWNAGELWGTQWNYILILFVWLAAFGTVTMYYSRRLNAINLGYDIATGLGVNVKSSFIILSFLAVGMSSASVAFGGNFFFLGLIGPHIARKLVGTDARFLIPASGIASAVIIILANILVEDVSVFMNIPTGIFVSILSVPYFLYLLIRSR